MCFRNQIQAGIKSFFADADPDLSGDVGPLTHEYQMTDNYKFWWCDRKGTWTTNSSAISGLKTPLEMLSSTLYAMPNICVQARVHLI